MNGNYYFADAHILLHGRKGSVWRISGLITRIELSTVHGLEGLELRTDDELESRLSGDRRHIKLASQGARH